MSREKGSGNTITGLYPVIDLAQFFQDRDIEPCLIIRPRRANRVKSHNSQNMKILPFVLLFAVLLLPMGCVDRAVEKATDVVKDKIFEGSIGMALKAAIEQQRHNCVVIDIFSHTKDHQQIVVRKGNVKREGNGPCSVVTKDAKTPYRIVTSLSPNCNSEYFPT